METLQLLGVALGLASLAGINLYLTVFVTGLSIQQGWIILSPQYEQLAVLSDPAVVWVSGALFVMEFFADKIPWVDSAWDSIHTLIRPIGGAMLAITVLGDSHPVYDVLVGLFGGSVALTSHGAKAGARLLANASPEPFSNIGLSLVEDATVIAGLALIHTHPIAALLIVAGAFALAIWLLPRLFRAARATLWFGWRRIQHLRGAEPASSALPDLPPDLEIELCRQRGEDVALQWASPCVAGRGPEWRRNTFGWLLLSNEGLDFARLSGNRPRIHPVATEGWKATHRPGWVSDRVILYRAGDSQKRIFQFDRSRRHLALSLVEALNSLRERVDRRRPVEA